MRTKALAGVGAVALGTLLLGGCAPVVRTTSPKEVVAVAPTTAGPFVPAGTRFTVVVRQGLSTRTAIPGERFTAEVVTPLAAGDGSVLVPAGARLTGRVAAVQSGPPRLTLALEEVQTTRGPADVEAKVTRSKPRVYLAGRPTNLLAYPQPLRALPESTIERPPGIVYGGVVVGEADLPPGSPLELTLTRPLAPR